MTPPFTFIKSRPGFRLTGLLLVNLFFCTVSLGQTLANWAYTANTTPGTVAAHITVTDAIYTTTPTSPSISSSRFRAQGWNVPNMDVTKYFEVSITPASTYSVTVSQFALNVQNTGASGVPNQYLVAVSTDGFVTSTTIGSGAVTSSATTINFPVSTVTTLTNTVVFRAYFWGATDAAKFISIGSTTISGTVQSPALPVNLISFHAKPVMNAVQLNWVTTWEQSADRFVVQRSSNAAEFTEIGTLAAGNTSSQRTYALLDEQPANGINYYRLKQVDQDGSVNYSKIIAVIVNVDQPSIQVLPNPSDGRQFTLQVRNLIAPTATIQTLSGQTVQGKWLTLTTTNATWQPDSPLPPGLYLLTVRDGVMRQAVKVLVQ